MKSKIVRFYLSDSEKKLIMDSFALMMGRQESLAHEFYKCLFEFSPLLVPMFKKPMELQEKHFIQVIQSAVTNIQNPQELLPELDRLGQVHQGKGITDDHFVLVKSAFLLAIQSVLRSDSSPEIEGAWESYIDQLSAVIKNHL